MFRPRMGKEARSACSLTIEANANGSDLPTKFEDVKKSVQGSLDRLGSRPNLLLIHSPYVAEKGKIGELWTILEDLVMDGTLKDVSLGVSNFVPHHLEEVLKVARIKPACHRRSWSSNYLGRDEANHQNSSSTHTSLHT